MLSHPAFRFLLYRLLPAALLVGPAAAALAQQAAPQRGARLALTQGLVVFSRAGDDAWTDAQPARLLGTGDRLWTQPQSRSGLDLGNATVRIDSQTQLDLHALDRKAAQLVVMQGRLHARLHTLAADENFEIDTPHLAFRAAEPGDYRIDVDAQRGTTRVTVLAGSGAVYGEDGVPVRVAGRRQLVFSGRNLTLVAWQQDPPADAFDRWVESLEPPARPPLQAVYPAPPGATVYVYPQPWSRPAPTDGWAPRHGDSGVVWVRPRRYGGWGD